MNESEEKKDMKNKKFNALELDDFDEKLPYKSSVYWGAVRKREKIL